MTEDKFVRRSLRTLSAGRGALGHAACPTTVAGLLRELGYNLRVNVKRLTGPAHPDRDRQFRYLEGVIAEFRAAGVTVCHYPRGASKWNPVEHRLESQISRNWAGEPLRSPERMLSLLRGTQTQSGRTVTAEWTDQTYSRGASVTDKQMAQRNVEHHDTCPQWNYTIKPRETGWWTWN